jgi:hypothetical protein
MSTPLNQPGTVAKGSTLQRLLHRGSWERVSMALIALGAVMLMQPLSLDLFSYSFVVLLAGVIGYSIAAKLPG